MRGVASSSGDGARGAAGWARGVGHGKVILVGEHSVVHGEPAIATSVRHEVRVRLRSGSPVARPAADIQRALEAAVRATGLGSADDLAVEIEGDLPIGVGLGSSAALGVALVRALLALHRRDADDAEVARRANDIERVFHGTPSGIDATTAAHHGWLWFEAGPPPYWEALRPAREVPLVVVLSGTRHQTASAVGGLRERAAAAPGVYGPIFRSIGEIVRSARLALESGDWSGLGELLSANHALLRSCGVSTPALDRITDDARDCGALGAKLTGAGGGGAVIALSGEDAEGLATRLRARGWKAFPAGPTAGRAQAPSV